MNGLSLVVCALLGLAGITGFMESSWFVLPHGYYTFLRLSVCAYAVFAIFRERENGVCFSNVALALLALLFNPIQPVDFSRQVWRWLDAAAIIVLLLARMPWKKRWEQAVFGLILLSVFCGVGSFARQQYLKEQERQRQAIWREEERRSLDRRKEI